MLRHLKVGVAIGAVAAMLGGFATGADALAMKFSYNGGPFFQVVDNDLNDLSSTAGHVLWNGSVGAFSVGAASSLSSVNFSNEFASLGTNVHALTTTGGPHELVVMASDTDFIAPAPGFDWLTTNDFSLTALGGSGSVSWAAYIDFGNVLYGTGTLIASSTANLVTDDVFTQIVLAAAQTTTPFSLTHVFTVSHPGTTAALRETQFTNNTHLQVVPEPATLGFIGVGLIGLAAVACRRRKPE